MTDHTHIWTYPLRGRGLLILLAGWLVIGLNTACAASSVEMIPQVLWTLGGLYFCAFAYLIVRDTALGRDDIKDWPGFPTREAFFYPVARIVAGAIWSCLPALLYRLINAKGDLLFWLLFLLGGYLLPMVLVRVSSQESFLAGQPMAVLISILRTLRDYTTVCVPYYIAVLATALAASWIGREGWIKTAGLVYALAFYTALVQLYRLGLFYRRNRDKLSLRGVLLPPAQAAPAPAPEPAAPTVSLPPDVPAGDTPETDV
jgi:hypothetical protein